MGFAPDALHANPRLIVVRISGFGQDGPYRERPGFGSLVEVKGFSCFIQLVSKSVDFGEKFNGLRSLCASSKSIPIFADKFLSFLRQSHFNPSNSFLILAACPLKNSSKSVPSFLIFRSVSLKQLVK